MSVNKHKPHVCVIPEDDATRQLANGFGLHPSLDINRFDLRPFTGGWLKTFDDSYIKDLRNYSARHLILLIDFDNRDVNERLTHLKKMFPPDIQERVYILGVYSEAEDLKREFKKPFEEIGKILAEDCANGVTNSWGKELLKHNEHELDRLIASVKPFLFPES
ncbi:hypothetical protein FACS1894158_18220 [Betaproteobacteria bacterium]|nr:hypothetical protein FACS1894158_18220 [Betaproteobacteria bacterium]